MREVGFELRAHSSALQLTNACAPGVTIVYLKTSSLIVSLKENQSQINGYKGCACVAIDLILS